MTSMIAPEVSLKVAVVVKSLGAFDSLYMIRRLPESVTAAGGN